MANNLLFDIALVIVVATFLAYFAKYLRQPLLLAYIVAGVLIGSQGLGWITNFETIDTFAELGIAFLLFIVGLELDIRKIKDLGAVSAVAGLGQVIFTFIFGYFIALVFGFAQTAALYIGLALTLSSTIVVIKLYSDKNELNTLHGRIALGILLVQDLIAVIALILISGSSVVTVPSLVLAFIKGVALFVVVLMIGEFVLRYLFKTIAKSHELLFLSAVIWCLLVAYASVYLGFSIAIGGLLAGVSLAFLPYNIEMIALIRPLRDFFVPVFFVVLGMQLVFTAVKHLYVPIIAFSAFVIIGGSLIIMILMCLLGFKSRNSFLTGIGLGQISEFSLVIIFLGNSMGHVSNEIVSLIVIIAVITITLSSYLITFDDQIYRFLSKFLKYFEYLSPKNRELEYVPGDYKYDVILCGYNRIGYSIENELKSQKKKFLIVDFNPEVIKRLISAKIPCLYGDIGDLGILDRLNLDKAKLVISTVPDKNDNLLLIKKTKAANKKVVVIVTANHVDEALGLYEAGADYVMLPHFVGGDYLSLLLRKLDITTLVKRKLTHIKELQKRKPFHH